MDVQLKEATIFVTNKCNLKCKTCFMYGLSEENGLYHFPKRHSSMDMEFFKKTVDQICAENPNCVFYIMGGEPLIHKNIVDMVQYIKNKYGAYVDINTNCWFLQDKGEQLLKAGLDNFIISLDGHNHEICDTVRGEGVFDKVIESIKFLNILKKQYNYQTKISINTVITNLNYSSLDKMVELCEELSVDHLYLSFPVFIDKKWGIESQEKLKNLFQINFESWKGFLISDLVTSINMNVLKGQLEKIKNMRPSFTIVFIPFDFTDTQRADYYTHNWVKHVQDKACEKLFYRTTILPDGEIVPCTTYFDLVVGNLHEEDFSAIWNGKKYNDFREKISQNLLPMCYRCCDLLDESDGDKYTINRIR